MEYFFNCLLSIHVSIQDVFDTLEAKVKVNKHNLSLECHGHWSAILSWPKSMITLNLCLKFKCKSSCRLCWLTALSVIIPTLLHPSVRRYMGSQKLVSGFFLIILGVKELFPPHTCQLFILSLICSLSTGYWFIPVEYHEIYDRFCVFHDLFH